MALKHLGIELDHVFSCDNNKQCKATIMANFPPMVWYSDVDMYAPHPDGAFAVEPVETDYLIRPQAIGSTSSQSLTQSRRQESCSARPC